MFMGQSQLKALKRYAAVETDSRVEGATPHQLVRILFDELLLAIDAATAALRASDRAISLALKSGNFGGREFFTDALGLMR